MDFDQTDNAKEPTSSGWQQKLFSQSGTLRHMFSLLFGFKTGQDNQSLSSDIDRNDLAIWGDENTNRIGRARWILKLYTPAVNG